MIQVDYNNGIIAVKPENISENDLLIRHLRDIPGVGYDPQTGWLMGCDYVHQLNAITAKLVGAAQFEATQRFKDWIRGGKLDDVLVINAGVLKSQVSGNNIPFVELENACKYFFKPAVRQASFKNKKWDGYVKLYSQTTNRFPTGLMYLVTETLDKLGRKYKIVYNYERRPQRQFNWVANDKITPDPDQVDAIKLADKYLRGVIKAPTGFGKTAVLAVGIMANFGVPALFVANKKSLLDDAKEAFINLIDGIKEDDVDEIKDGVFGKIKISPDMKKKDIPSLDSKIIVATIQSIHARLEDPRTSDQMKSWLNHTCKLVTVDETQAVGTKIWDQVLDQCRAPLRFALSATPKRSDGATLKIHAQSGDTIFFTTAEEQVEKGRLCELDIQYKPFDHKLFNEKDDSVEYSEAYTEWIVHNEERNGMIVRETLDLVNEGRFTLVLINRIDHGHVLQDLLVGAGLNEEDVRFVYGDTKDQARRSAIHEFRRGAFKVLIGSTIFDAGVNIPVISGVVIAGAGNSEITLIQKIGRGARNVDYEEVLGYLPDFMKENPGQKVTTVVDIFDDNVKFFKSQAWNRYKTAKEEFGASRVKIIGELYRKPKGTAKTKTQVDQFSSQLAMLEGFDSQAPAQRAGSSSAGQYSDFLSAFKTK